VNDYSLSKASSWYWFLFFEIVSKHYDLILQEIIYPFSDYYAKALNTKET
jgi:hypothetical protein